MNCTSWAEMLRITCGLEHTRTIRTPLSRIHPHAHIPSPHHAPHTHISHPCPHTSDQPRPNPLSCPRPPCPPPSNHPPPQPSLASVHPIAHLPPIPSPPTSPHLPTSTGRGVPGEHDGIFTMKDYVSTYVRCAKYVNCGRCNCFGALFIQ